MSITICDETANFGTGLNNVGATSQNTDDAVYTSLEGTSANQGIFHAWVPCNGAPLIQINANVAWDLHTCATQPGGTSSLAIHKDDLRFGNNPGGAGGGGQVGFDPNNPPSYAGVLGGTLPFLDRADVAFGQVSADGTIDPAIPGLVSFVDDLGSFYVKEGVVHVTISSIGPWRGSCHASIGTTELPVTQSGQSRLEWRLTGTIAWTAFAGHKSSTDATACFPNRAIGTITYTYDLRLRVEQSDPPGPFTAAVTYTVSPQADQADNSPDID